MIHQMIFAFPRPGMSEEEFHQYWLQEHAVRYAGRIPQIKRYAVDTRVPRPGESDEPLWSGIAEIWLENDEQQLASLQTPEFLEGARLDEPRWAAFWRTVVVDTETEHVLTGLPDERAESGVKLVMLLKRREGTTVEQFRRYSREVHAPLVAALPGIRRHDQCFTRDGAYAVAETPFDAVYHLWFDDPSAVDAMRKSAEWERCLSDREAFANPRYVHELLFRQNWVIGPEFR